jgi:hypothetical protein
MPNGRIGASRPGTIDWLRPHTRELPRELVGDGTLFRLRVRGDSMINAAIADGDMVVVRQQSQAENGEIVATMLHWPIGAHDGRGGERGRRGQAAVASSSKATRRRWRAGTSVAIS